MTDNIAGLIEELCRLIKDPAVDVALSPVLMAAMKQVRALAQENERAKGMCQEAHDKWEQCLDRIHQLEAELVQQRAYSEADIAQMRLRVSELEADRDSLQH